MPPKPAACLVFGSRADVPPLASRVVAAATSQNPACVVLVSGTPGEAKAIEAALADVDKSKLYVDECARSTEDNARWATAKLKMLGLLDADCAIVLIAFPVLARSAVDALAHHRLDASRVHAAFTPAEIDEAIEVNPGWVEAKRKQHADGLWAGKPAQPPKLRVLLEVRSWNSGLNGDEVARVLRQMELATTGGGARLVVVKAPLMVRRACATLRRALRKAAPEGSGEARALPTLVPFAPEVDLKRLSEDDAKLAEGEYRRLATTSGQDAAKHFLDLDDDGTAPLVSTAALERNLSAEQCKERAAVLAQHGASLTTADVASLGPSLTPAELESVGGDAVVVFGDPADVEAPLRAAEALQVSKAPMLIISGAFGPKGPDALAREVEKQAAAEGQPPWRHTRKWRNTKAALAVAASPSTAERGLRYEPPLPLPPVTLGGEPEVLEGVMKSAREPRAPRFLTETDCYLEFLLGRLEASGYLAELQPADVIIERDA